MTPKTEHICQYAAPTLCLPSGIARILSGGAHFSAEKADDLF